MRKYGVGAFSQQILAHTNSQKQLNEMETVWIFLMNSKVPNGYNLTDGGEAPFGMKHSLKTRQKMSQDRKGVKLTPQQCRQHSKSAKAQWRDPVKRQRMLQSLRSPETRQKFSVVKKGKKFSEEHCRKIGDAHRGRKVPLVSRKRLSKSVKTLWQNADFQDRWHASRWDAAHRKSQGDKSRGRVYSAEIRARMSAGHKDTQNGKDNPFYGRHHTEATKQKIRDAIALRKQYQLT
jgi:group I intron endonuclease